MIVAVIGLGYVGGPLAERLRDCGHDVRGWDPPRGIEDDLAGCAAYVVCVPTPLWSGRPDLRHVQDAVATIERTAPPDALRILVSTVAPGTTRALGFHVMSPERMNPGDPWTAATPRLVGGIDPSATDRAVDLLSDVAPCIPVASPEIAEAAKLLENTFRLVNIGLVNWFDRYCAAAGIDTEAVIHAAATKPYGFLPFHPGGVGGHCIPVDPVYLAAAAAELGIPDAFVGPSLDESDAYVRRLADQVTASTGTVALVGVGFKPGVDDTRNTPAAELRRRLEDRGLRVVYHDPLVPAWNGLVSVPLGEALAADVVVEVHHGRVRDGQRAGVTA